MASAIQRSDLSRAGRCSRATSAGEGARATRRGRPPRRRAPRASGRRRAARRWRSRRRPCDSFEPSGAADQRVVGEPRRRRAAEQPAEPDLGRRRVEEVLAADDEVDAVAEVVDDHAQARRSSCRSGRGRGGRRRSRRDRTEHRRSRSSHASSPSPSATRSVSPVRAREAPRRQPPGTARARTTSRPFGAAMRRTSSGSSRRHRRRSPARAARAPPHRPARCRSGDTTTGPRAKLVGRRLVRRRCPSRSRSSSSARLVLGAAALAVVVLDPQDHPAAEAPREAPDVDRVGEMAEVEAAGRRRREARGRAGVAPSRARAAPAGPRPSSRREPLALGGLERPRGGDEPAVDREQVGLGRRALVGDRDAEQHLALPLAVADRTPPERQPSRARPRAVSSARSLSRPTIRRSSSSISARRRASSGLVGGRAAALRAVAHGVPSRSRGERSRAPS